MIILNYPNNPAGNILPEELQDNIIQVAREHDLYVLSDEIYEEYDRRPDKDLGLRSFWAVSYTHLTLPTKRIV